MNTFDLTRKLFTLIKNVIRIFIVLIAMHNLFINLI
jgi:hypothetical protein